MKILKCLECKKDQKVEDEVLGIVCEKCVEESIGKCDLCGQKYDGEGVSVVAVFLICKDCDYKLKMEKKNEKSRKE